MNIFSKELLEKASKPIPLWNKFKLIFRPVNYSYDDGCELLFKELDGYVHITKIRISKPKDVRG